MMRPGNFGQGYPNQPYPNYVNGSAHPPQAGGYGEPAKPAGAPQEGSGAAPNQFQFPSGPPVNAMASMNLGPQQHQGPPPGGSAHGYASGPPPPGAMGPPPPGSAPAGSFGAPPSGPAGGYQRPGGLPRGHIPPPGISGSQGPPQTYQGGPTSGPPGPPGPPGPTSSYSGGMLSGPPSGPPGPASSYHGGPPSGPPPGPPSGPASSYHGGPPSGPPSGPPGPPGPASSYHGGPPSGPPGPTSSYHGGPPSGPTGALASSYQGGMPVGPQSSHSQPSFSGPPPPLGPAGTPMFQPPPPGSRPGPPPGPHGGPQMGVPMGPPPPQGLSMGQQQGLMSGPTMGPPMGQPMGQPMGPPPGSYMGPPSPGGISMGPPPTGPGATYPSSGPAMPSHPGMGGMPPQPAQQRPRINPDHLPSPIQVMLDDQARRSGVFESYERGVAPPLVSTEFMCRDGGNCNPRFMRSTLYTLPASQDLIKQSNLVMAVTVSPFARLRPDEAVPPLVDLGEIGPIRCHRCKAYMSPYMQFVDGGRKFRCCICESLTEVVPEYFAHLDHTGRRTDAYNRAELCLGSYEFVATKDYCKNNQLPKPPAFIFMIDVSYNSVRSGLVHLICSKIKEDILPFLPKEAGSETSSIRVGFVTYDNQLHFYNLKSSLGQPQMMIVGDVEDVFVPLVDGFLVDATESEALIDGLMELIPELFANTRTTDTVLGPVIQAGMEALKASECAGKLFVFNTSLPIAEAPGKLKNRDDRSLLGTEKEKQILSPVSDYYTKLGQQCVDAACSVDLFLFPNAYIDVATIGQVCKVTGGQIYKYSNFLADTDGQRFMDDLRADVERQVAFDAIMKLRTSTGIRATDFFGNFHMPNTSDVEMAAIDSEKGITVEIKHDDKLSVENGAVVQAAILYTSISGQRRLRVHNLGLNCSTQVSDLYRTCDLETLVNFLAKSAVRQVTTNNPKAIREVLVTQSAQILACYRKNCTNSSSSSGQLILPEGMKLLPLYANCIIKSDLLQGGSDMSTDDRSWLLYAVMSMGVSDSLAYFYPRLIPIHDVKPDSTGLPSPIRCSAERLADNGVYLLDNGLVLFMWIGLSVDAHWIQDVFGVQSAAQIDIEKAKLMELDSAVSQRVREIVKLIRSERRKHLRLFIVRQRDRLEPWFRHYLVEDAGNNGSSSYVDFLCHLHREIRNLTS